MHKRDRGHSPVEYLDKARRVQITMIKIMGNPKIVPKAYRFTLALPAVEDVKQLMRHLMLAERFIPTDKQRLWERKRHLITASGICNMLLQDLALIKDCGIGVDTNQFEQTIRDIRDEKAEIQRVLDHTHVVKRRQSDYGDKLADGLRPMASTNSGNTNNVPIVNTDGTANNNNYNNSGGLLP